MESPTITTLVKMMETLPEPAQSQVVEHLRDYIETLQDETHWDALYQRTQPKLVEAARRARRQIAEGKAAPLDESHL